MLGRQAGRPVGRTAPVVERREGTALCCLEVELATVAETLDVENKGGEVPRFLACAQKCHLLKWRGGRGQAGGGIRSSALNMLSVRCL